MAPGEVTQVLAALHEGNPRAAERLLPLVYEQLRDLAQRYLGRERTGHTLQPTALVHEAYVRLVGKPGAADWEDRAHFFAVAARAMRQVLVDHARTRRAAKRGGLNKRFPLEAAETIVGQPDEYVVALDEALSDLAAFDPHLARLVELRFFGGLSVEETAKLLGSSISTVKRDWIVAKGWLHRAISGGR